MYADLGAKDRQGGLATLQPSKNLVGSEFAEGGKEVPFSLESSGTIAPKARVLEDGISKALRVSPPLES